MDSLATIETSNHYHAELVALTIQELTNALIYALAQTMSNRLNVITAIIENNYDLAQQQVRQGAPAQAVTQQFVAPVSRHWLRGPIRDSVKACRERGLPTSTHRYNLLCSIIKHDKDLKTQHMGMLHQNHPSHVHHTVQMQRLGEYQNILENMHNECCELQTRIHTKLLRWEDQIRYQTSYEENKILRPRFDTLRSSAPADPSLSLLDGECGDIGRTECACRAVTKLVQMLERCHAAIAVHPNHASHQNISRYLDEFICALGIMVERLENGELASDPEIRKPRRIVVDVNKQS